ncbi:helix-turn-helix domain-containing protein [Arthrobacter sp. H5]|uniref:helix-turn-helix transcriptional regulator n=1 Tax=Arthrobacter sp. H5 TaxID=1267973 RepID=UPI0004B0B4A2|nr:helix-turn-helix domain-containing protein [Arthrobacter sp. H5]
MKAGLMVGAMMTPKDVAGMYGVTSQELAQWRRANVGPPYFMLGRNTVRYDAGDIEDWFNDPANGYLHDYPVGR